MIKVEVDKAIVQLKLNVKELNNDSSKNALGENNDKTSNTNDLLINALKDEIVFLRKELASKDKIIEMVIKDNAHKIQIHNGNMLNHVITTDISNPLSKSRETVHKTNNTLNKDSNCSVENNILKDEDIYKNGNKRKHRSTAIIGDSMLKDIEPRKMRKAMGRSEKVYIKSFSGVDTDAMKYYVKPTMKYKNDLLILHFGTNDLRSDKCTDNIANEIINIGIQMKTEKNEIMISGITPRGDNENLDKKGSEVNKILINLCSLYNFHFINNNSISKAHHLNSSGLHLNIKDTHVLANNILDAIRL